jgi:flagellar biosynthesis/type III secretory pathway protein FliH
MSPAYTRWIHHGESPGAEIIESREEEVHHDRYDYDEGINLGEDDGQDDGQDDDHRVTEMLADLYTSLEADGGNPRFTKVLNDAK